MGEYNNSSIKNLTDFIEKFGSITYTLNNQTYNQSNLNLLNTNTFNGNEIFINIPSRINDASNIYLDINIRNIKYRYKLN